MARKIIVIGGGPGGYVAAIRAAQLGAEVHLIEQEAYGGTCLNVGCIPTKALLHSAKLYRQIVAGGPLGIKTAAVEVDWDVLMKHKQGIVNRLVQGVAGLLQANGVVCHRGKGRLTSSTTVEVIDIDKPYELAGDVIILATGSENVSLSLPGSHLPGVISSTEALCLPQCPQSLVIIGGGVIGIEFASLYSALGTQVTVVELLAEILPMMDADVTGVLKEELVRQGVAFLTQGALRRIEKESRRLVALVEHQGEEKRVAAEYVMVAVGRRARTGGLNLEQVGVALEGNKIKVDKYFRTSIPAIYAIGDCNGQSMLAHTASAQGMAAVEHALDLEGSYWGKTSPACVYSEPEIASVGMREQEARKLGLPVKVGIFPLAGNGKSLIENNGVGMIKIVAGANFGEILGVQIIGPRATDVIAEAALAIRLEATVEEVISTIHSHPTVSEAMGEAAMMLQNGAIHWPPQGRKR